MANKKEEFKIGDIVIAHASKLCWDSENEDHSEDFYGNIGEVIEIGDSKSYRGKATDVLVEIYNNHFEKVSEWWFDASEIEYLDCLTDEPTIKTYPELEDVAQYLSDELCKRINHISHYVQSEMPYKAGYILETVIKNLQERV